MRDTSMDGPIRKGVSARMGGPLKECADDNIMAAYLEGSLSPQERAAFEDHASRCVSCQETLALCMKMRDREDAGPAADEESTAKKTFFHISVPIPVLGGLFMAIVLAVVLFRFWGGSKQEMSNPQISEMRQSARDAAVVVHNAPTQALSEHKAEPPAKVPAAEGFIGEEKAKKSAESVIQARARFVSPSTQPEAPKPEEVPAANMATAVPRMRDQSVSSLSKDESMGKLDKVSVSTLYQPLPPANQSGTAKQSETKMAEVGQEENRAEGAVAPETATAARERDEEESPRASSAAIARMKGLAPLGLTPAPQSATAGKRAGNKEADWRKIRDKVFDRESGLWVDRQCAKHPEAEVIEITEYAPEYRSILNEYPQLSDLLPVKIYWEGKIYLRRK